MESLNSNYIKEQNKIASSGAWIWLLEIATTGLSTLRYTSDNAVGAPSQLYVTWNGNNYFSLPFTMDDIMMSTSGEFPIYKLQLDQVDLSGAIRARVKATSGLVGSTVRIMVVHSDHLDITTPAVDELAEVLGCEVTAESVILTIGIPSLLSRRFPRDRYVSGFCRHKFAGGLCQYTQPVSTIVSSKVAFTLGDQTGANPANTIYVADFNLVTLFSTATPTGAAQGANWALSKDTGFTITGSLFNDGFFLADNFYAVRPDLVYVMAEPAGGRPLVAETVLTGVTIQLGYNECDHSLEACELRDNTQNYGGSPGIVGGMYG